MKGKRASSTGEFDVLRDTSKAASGFLLTYIKMRGDTPADRRIDSFIERLCKEGETFSQRVAEMAGDGCAVTQTVTGSVETSELVINMTLLARRGARIIKNAAFEFRVKLKNGRITDYVKKSRPQL